MEREGDIGKKNAVQGVEWLVVEVDRGDFLD
jgi:hypothetical protein